MTEQKEQELTEKDLHDYCNQFSAIISAKKLGIPIENQIEMPHVYLKQRYPGRYDNHVIYPKSFNVKALQEIIDYFNQSIKKTKELFDLLFKKIGELFYGDSQLFSSTI